ncbi:hypothetical protein LEP1GSC192_3150 [Leptospira sp. B5-022]|nr:hypothetical protein LEP1GSC192_3150 [Leptospira sp. B5-022]
MSLALQSKSRAKSFGLAKRRNTLVVRRHFDHFTLAEKSKMGNNCKLALLYFVTQRILYEKASNKSF